MAKLGSEKRPLVLRVRTQEQAQNVAQRCAAGGWRFIVGIEPDEPEDISDLERALNPAEPVLTNKVGRNEPCPCGSGRKYKRCCAQGESIPARAELSPGRFRYEPGSYGGPPEIFLPSILCCKQADDATWQTHFCLVKPDGIFDTAEAATTAAEQHLSIARARQVEGGIAAFAIALKNAGYVRLSDFEGTDIRRNVLQAVAYIQQCAAELRTEVAVCGDWILFSAESGDAWMLEPAEALAVRLAQDSDPFPDKVMETPERFAVYWDTGYRIEGNAFICGDSNGRERAIVGYPVETIRKAMSAQ